MNPTTPDFSDPDVDKLLSPEAVETLAGFSPELSERFRRVEAIVFDFDGVFTDNTVWVAETGAEMVRCSRSDGIGLAKLRALGIRAMVLSTEANSVVSARCRKLKIACVQGCPDKAEALPGLVEGQLQSSLTRTAYLGNDINDAGVLQIAGLPLVVADAHPDVAPFAAWRTTRPGGFGAVREVCELLVAARSARR